MHGYIKDFNIEKAVSNNAFSFGSRSNRSLYVPSMVDGDFADLSPGDKTVFEDADENGEIKSCTGLKNFIAARWGGIPVYVVDNHNHAFYFWHYAAAKGEIGYGLPLIHVDQHKDARLPARWLSAEESRNSDAVFNYTNTVLNVGNFVPAALRTGVISGVINVTSQKEMDEFRLPLAPPDVDPSTAPADSAIFPKYILDLDMDFFAPEMDYIKPENKIALIKKLLPQAALVTVATSPFFMDQKSAINYLLKIFS